MMWPRTLLSLILLVAAGNAAALRCDNRVLNPGDSDARTRALCGAPYWIDGYVDTEITGAGHALEMQRDVPIDIWYYNFGPRRLLVQLVFRAGVLVHENTLGYGVETIGDDCNPQMPYTGMSVGELVAHCGEPAARRVNNGYVGRRPAAGVEQWRALREEEWTYDFGAGHLPRRLRLRDGRIHAVDTLTR
ncbi:MAG: DUF2845 domain-containing protein [Dokdonella sp.]|uniref:DUF2845 domain-containing protein n=1 Tax=Dokdonella sp. TaxID=2291710 RepID=UPI0025C257D2|nr:DUF2845 domain-containing protein [Dokdonella sp.]MBZ0222339.1 DUF2845 domain-containing protein [Dokdonella sp.]